MPKLPYKQIYTHQDGWMAACCTPWSVYCLTKARMPCAASGACSACVISIMSSTTDCRDDDEGIGCTRCTVSNRTCRVLLLFH